MGAYDSAQYKAWYAAKAVELKLAALAAYGGVCYCCAESHPAFLTLDHLNDDGAAYRRALGNRSKGGFHTYKHLKKLGYPQDLGLVVSCWNCNTGRHINGGTCPHQEVTP